MGQCISAKKSGGIGSEYDPTSPTSEECGSFSTLPLDFVLHISNVKLKDAPYESISCRLSIPGTFEAELPKLPRAKTIKVDQYYNLVVG